MQRLDDVLAAPVPSRAPTKQHLLLKASVVLADRGVFEAVISTEAVDRERDVVLADAMVEALQAWTSTGKLIPLLWSHSSKAEDSIGHVNPESAKAIDGEVHVTGWIDQATPRGKEAWRLVKSGVLGFSFGYLIPDGGATRRADGTREIRELDVFEISACSTPMNGDTRVTAWKSADREPMSLDALRQLEADLGLGVPAELQKVRDEMRDQMLAVLGGTNGDRAKTLRARADRVTREFGPIEVATFDA
jgi:HK97 family phage prohead protease